MGFIAMKALAGGLLTNIRACRAWMNCYDNVVPIWGIQWEKELDELLAAAKEQGDSTAIAPDMQAIIDKDRKELAGEFCRGCGYCMPCPQGIQINNCARMIQMIRRAPQAAWTNDYWRGEMARIEKCTHCKSCVKKCPYGLNTPDLLQKALADYKTFL
jgi:predicted aldo/keto reductase-like oxidoreductase